MPPILWDFSLVDIETRTRLKVGQIQSLVVQDYQNLVSVISSVLGSPDAEVTSKASPEPAGFKPKNEDELKMAFNSVFGAR